MRAKAIECPDCEGDGYELSYDEHGSLIQTVACETCHSLGWVWSRSDSEARLGSPSDRRGLVPSWPRRSSTSQRSREGEARRYVTMDQVLIVALIIAIAVAILAVGVIALDLARPAPRF